MATSAGFSAIVEKRSNKNGRDRKGGILDAME
jgi:hypothetical protein